MVPLLAACGGGTSSSATSTAAGTPRRGGTLRVAYVGGGTAETINPSLAVTPIDEGRVQSIFDPLVVLNADLSTSPGLALEFNSNKNATVYEVKLRPDVTFHNGKTLSAQDVIYSIGLMAKPTSNALPFVSEINLPEMKAINKTTLRIPLKFPDADLAANFVYYNTWIVQDGEKDFAHPVGTGPFKFESFTPGQQSVFSRNPHYWGSGGPYVDTLKIVSINDNSARLNALLAGQATAAAEQNMLSADPVSPAEATAHRLFTPSQQRGILEAPRARNSKSVLDVVVDCPEIKVRVSRRQRFYRERRDLVHAHRWILQAAGASVALLNEAFGVA